MDEKKMEMPQEEVTPDEEKIKGENLEGEIDPVEPSEEKRSLNPIKRIQELQAKKKELQEEKKELQEEKEGEAKEKIDGLFLEMENRIKNGKDTISQRQKLFKLGSNPELELAEYVKDKLIGLKKIADDVFPKMIEDLKKDLENSTSDEYHPDDFDKGKRIFNKKDKVIKELEETYKHTLEKFERDIDDLS